MSLWVAKGPSPPTAAGQGVPLVCEPVPRATSVSSVSRTLREEEGVVDWEEASVKHEPRPIGTPNGQLQCLLIWYMRGAAISCAHSSLFVRSLLMGRYCCRYRSTNRMSSEFPGLVCWRDCGQRQPCASLHSSPRLSCPEAAASPPSHVHGGRGYLVLLSLSFKSCGCDLTAVPIARVPVLVDGPKT